MRGALPPTSPLCLQHVRCKFTFTLHWKAQGFEKFVREEKTGEIRGSPGIAKDTPLLVC
jgi:hypothetical protein